MAQMIRGVVFDIEGVLEYQGDVYPYAVDTIQKLRTHCAILDKQYPQKPGFLCQAGT